MSNLINNKSYNKTKSNISGLTVYDVKVGDSYIFDVIATDIAIRLNSRNNQQVKRVVMHGTGTPIGNDTDQNQRPTIDDYLSWKISVTGDRKSNFIQGIGLFDFYIERDGTIYKLKNTNWAAHHGSEGQENKSSIGIELANGHKIRLGETENSNHYTTEQYRAAGKLIKYLKDKVYENINEVTTHDNILIKNQGRGKGCPGPKYRHDLIDKNINDNALRVLRQQANRVVDIFTNIFKKEDNDSPLIPQTYKPPTSPSVDNNNPLSYLGGYLVGLKQDILDNINEKIMETLIQRMSKSYNINLKGKVSGYSINWVSGNSIPINIEGENAPVIQSMGGRKVQITLDLIVDDIGELTQLLSMFKVSDKIDAIISLFYLSGNIYNGVSTERHRALYSYVRKQHNIDLLETVKGKKLSASLESPIKIKNSTLNNIGLNTFYPESMEYSKNSDSGGYVVKLTIMYVNNRLRYNESLVKLIKPKISGILSVLTSGDYE